MKNKIHNPDFDLADEQSANHDPSGSIEKEISLEEVINIDNKFKTCLSDLMADDCDMEDFING